eukprot:EG_transcript_6460
MRMVTLPSSHNGVTARTPDAALAEWGEVACRCRCQGPGQACAVLRGYEEEIRRLNEEMVAQLDDAVVIQRSQDERVEELAREVAGLRQELAAREAERVVQEQGAHRQQQLLESRLSTAEHKAAVLEKEAERWQRKAEAQSQAASQQGQTMVEALTWQLQETVASLEAREAALLERISALTDELDAARDEGSRLREQLQAVQQRCQAAEVAGDRSAAALAAAQEQAAAEGKAHVQCLAENGALRAEVAFLQRRLETAERSRREPNAENGHSRPPELPSRPNKAVAHRRAAPVQQTAEGLPWAAHEDPEGQPRTLPRPFPVAPLSDLSPAISQLRRGSSETSLPPSLAADLPVGSHPRVPPSLDLVSPSASAVFSQSTAAPIPASPLSRSPFATEQTMKHAQSVAALEQRLLALSLQRGQDEAELARLLEARGPAAKSSSARQRRAELERTLAASEREVHALRLQLRTLGFL